MMGFKSENDADKIDFAVFTKNTLSNGLFLYFFLKHIGCQAALVTFVSKTDKIQIDRLFQKYGALMAAVFFGIFNTKK